MKHRVPYKILKIIFLINIKHYIYFILIKWLPFTINILLTYMNDI